MKDTIPGEIMKDILRKLFYLFLFIFFISCGESPLMSSKSLEKFLVDENLNYIIDKEGDFKILADAAILNKDVWIRTQLNHSASVAVREIFSVSILISEDELNSLSRVLLLDNMQTRIMGSWSIMLEGNPKNDKKKYLVLYTVKAGLDSDEKYILQAIKETSEAAYTLEKVLFLGI